MADGAELSFEDIREIVRIFSDSDLEELRVEVGGARLYLSKRGAAPAGDAPDRPMAAGPVGDGAALAATPPGRAPAARSGDDPPASAPPTDIAAAGTPGSTAASAADGLHQLRSPLLGVFYRRPSPDQPPFVEVGNDVGPGDPVCVVDVMKLFTQVTAGVAGRVVEICVEDGELVEHGQVLMRIEER
jgi:acetyl-CoA carboxylase biotin carboxyl carrier protein